MQIIQSPLGNNIHPLGVISSLSHPHTILLKKESHFLHSRSNFISPIQTKPPLVTSSRFLFSREHEPSRQPLIGWESWDKNSEFPLLEFDSFDSIASPENSNINSSESVRGSIPEVMPTRTDKNPSNHTSSEINTKGKSKSKKINKSQKPQEKKPKPKSKTKKTVKSSAAKNVEQFVDESNISITFNEDSLLALDKPLPVEANSKLPTLQLDTASDNTTIDNSYLKSITPNRKASTSPSVEDKSTLFRNITNDDLQLNSELTSSLPSAESSDTESILTSPKEIKLDDNASEPAETSPRELTLPNNVEQTIVPYSNFSKNEQQIITEASESVNISDIPVSPTSPQQDIEIYQVPSIVDNLSAASKINLIQAKEVSPTLNSPLEEELLNTNLSTASKINLIQAKEVSPTLNSPLKEELLNTNSNFEAITAIQPDLILESTTNNFVTDNAVVDNSLTLSSALISPDVDDTLHALANDENTVGAHSNTPLPHIAAPNLESSVAKSHIAIQQEIDSSVLSEFPANAPVQLTPTSADIEDTPSLFRNSDNNEQLVTLESQSAMAVNVSDVSANMASLEHNSNVENTISESTESQPILAPPEIGETPTITATSTSPETAIAPFTTTSAETAIAPFTATSAETAIAPFTATSAETAIAPFTATSPETAIAPFTATSPETAIAPFTATSPETAIAPLTATSPETAIAPFTATSPEIGETAIAPLITTTSPEIGKTAIAPFTATSPETAIAPFTTTSAETAIAPLTATSPETAIAPLTATSPETAIAPFTATSPETAIAPFITTSPETAETASIFRKIIDNEQTVESEFPTVVTNPKISTFVDTSDNPTSPQNEVSRSPQVEQNATIKNLPAPKGYATGGHLTDSHVENRQQIAPLDTVPAMLTPGEFVINTRDAQNNLPLLHHINTGGTPQDIILPSLQTPNFKESEEKTSPETPTKVDSFPDTSLQLKSAETHSPQISKSLIPSSLGLDIGKQKLSILNSPQLNLLQNETIHVDEPSPQYSSPPLIFRKANPTTNTPSQGSNTPSQWSSVEDLLNGNNDEFTSFNFSDVESNSQKYEFSHVSESPQVFAKHVPTPRGFADGGEVTPADISREIEPVTETIESVSSSSQEDDQDDTADLEALAREIYNRLRQRVEIERERHGGFSGRLPW